MKKKLNLYAKCLVLATGLCATHISFCPPKAAPESKSSKAVSANSKQETAPTTSSAPQIAYTFQDIGKQDQPGATKRSAYKSYLPGQSYHTRRAFVASNIDGQHAKEALKDPEFTGDLGVVLQENKDNLSTTISTQIAALNAFEKKRKEDAEVFAEKQKKDTLQFITNLRNNFQQAADPLHTVASVYALEKKLADAQMQQIHKDVKTLQKSLTDGLATFTTKSNELITSITNNEKKDASEIKKQLTACKNACREIRRKTQQANPDVGTISEDDTL